MKVKKAFVIVVCLTASALLLTGAAPASGLREPLDYHTVHQAFDHALMYVEENYALPGLSQLDWNAGALAWPDMANTVHILYVNKAETVSEIQANFRIDLSHAGLVDNQITVIVHTPDDPHFSHVVMLFDAEENRVWSGKVDVDGHVTEYMTYK